MSPGRSAGPDIIARWRPAGREVVKRKSRTFEIQVQEMTLHIQAATDVDEESRAAALSFWEILHTYSIRNPEFRSSKRPVKVPATPPRSCARSPRRPRERGWARCSRSRARSPTTSAGSWPAR